MSDEVAFLNDEGTEDAQVDVDIMKSSRSGGNNRKRRKKRNNSSRSSNKNKRRKRRRNSSSSGSNKRRKRRGSRGGRSGRKDMCVSRKMKSRDQRTCDRIYDDFCRSSKDRSRNSSMCRFIFGTGGSSRNYRNNYYSSKSGKDEELDEDTIYEFEAIVEDIEGELFYEDAE